MAKKKLEAGKVITKIMAALLALLMLVGLAATLIFALI